MSISLDNFNNVRLFYCSQIHTTKSLCWCVEYLQQDEALDTEAPVFRLGTRSATKALTLALGGSERR